MEKVKNTKNFTPVSDAILSDWKLWYKYFPVYIDIIVTLFLTYDSFIIFCHEKSVQLSMIGSYIFFCLVTWLKKKHFNWMGQFNVNYSHTGVFTFHVHIKLSQETKSNKAIK